MLIGGLSQDAEGLLLLTNDGDLAQALQEQAVGWSRQYRARVFGDVSPKLLLDLGRKLRARVLLDRRTASNSWLTLFLEDDTQQAIGFHLEELGIQSSRLIRVSFGPFVLGDLPNGGVELADPGLALAPMPAC
jgi:23S rRNA pseudouridine2605 synthase